MTWIVAGILVFIIADIALVAFALSGTRSRTSTVPEILPTVPASSVTPAPSSQPAASATPTAAAEGLATPASFLVALSATSAWKATAGACSVIDPVIESTTDGGVTWVTHSPGTLAAQQVLGLAATSDGDATIVAKTGVDCAVEDLATFSAGAFWDSYPTRLANQNYIDTAAPGIIHVQGATVAAPCPIVLDLRVSAGQPWVLCQGELFSQSASTGQWTSLKTAGAAAFTVTTAGALVASRGVAGCGGISVASLQLPLATATLTPLACVSAQPSSGPVALDARGEVVWLVADGTTRVSTTGGEAWQIPS